VSSLHDEVIRVLDDEPAENGVIVVKHGRVLAMRDPVPEGGAYIVMLDPGSDLPSVNRPTT
jgi:hypothetical protein